MIIPKGKIITIRAGDRDIFDDAGVKKPILTIDTEITIDLQSEFSNLLGTGVNKFLSVTSAAIYSATGKSYSGQFKEMGYKFWSGTDPISFSFDTTLNMKTSAKKDVFDPAKVLMKLPLPREPDPGEGFGLIAPGPSILSEISKDSVKFEKSYSFRCGVFYLPQVLFQKAEPTWSSDVDEDGYPIWCRIQIEVSSLYVATTNMIDGFGVKY